MAVPLVSWRILKWPLCVVSLTLLLFLCGRNNDVVWTQDSFETRIQRDPMLCTRLRGEIIALTRQRRPKSDLTFHDMQRANISGWVGGNRLVDGCWTYRERYRHFDGLPADYVYQSTCNQYYPSTRHARTAFVIRIGEHQTWVDDFKNAVQAVIVELGWRRGMDVYIFQHVDDHSTFRKDSVPEEFRPLTRQFTIRDASVGYPDSVTIPIRDPPKDIPVIAQFNHLAETFFMKTHTNYDYAWFSEGDTRAMGPWDIYLDDIDATTREILPDHRRIDLLTLTPSYRADPSWPWGASVTQFDNSTVTASLLQTHRVSRHMTDAMSAEHEAGRNAYHELFVPTVATKHNLTKFIYANPVFSDGVPPFTGMPFSGIAEVIKNDAGRLQSKNLWIGNTEKVKDIGAVEKILHGATYSPLDKFSERYYKQWMDNDNICRPLSLVHPVKT